MTEWNLATLYLTALPVLLVLLTCYLASRGKSE